MAMETVEVIEKNMRGRVNGIVPKIIEKLGLTSYKREDLSHYGCIIFLGLTGLIVFARTDLLNVIAIHLFLANDCSNILLCRSI